jgi:phosphoglycolate phosphatase
LAIVQCQQVRFSDVRAILFDKDGTLEDSEAYLRELGRKRARLIDASVPGTQDPLLMAFGISGDRLDPTGLIAVGSRRENEIAAAAYIAETGRGWLESLTLARRAFEEAERVMGKLPSPLFPGSSEALRHLSEVGLKLGILSAASTERVQAFVRHHQLDDYIQMKMGVDEGIDKPDPTLFLLACQRLGVEPDVTLMVGDSIGDMLMARQAGAAGCIHICWKGTSANSIQAADVTISKLDEIQVFKN